MPRRISSNLRQERWVRSVDTDPVPHHRALIGSNDLTKLILRCAQYEYRKEFLNKP
jgi:hypothetical protein